MSKTQFEALKLALEANIPVILWGKPGIGKTANVHGMADHVYVFNVNTREPVDISGAMHPGQYKDLSVTMYSPNYWAVELNEYQEAHPNELVVLFWDEFSTGTQTMQHATLRVVHEGVVGDYKLDPRIRQVLAANSAEDANGYELTGPTANRMIHLNWEVNADEVAEGFLYGGWIPKDEDEELESIIRGDILPYIAGYIQKSGRYLEMPKNAEQAGGAWASPRTWAHGARLLAVAKKNGASDDATGLLLTGAIGSGLAMEYLGYMRNLDLPDPETILADPKLFVRPKRQDQLFVLLGSIVSRVATKEGMTKERNVNAWKILAAVALGTDSTPKDPRPDLAAAHAKNLAMYLFNECKNRKDMGEVAKYLEPFEVMLTTAGLM